MSSTKDKDKLSEIDKELGKLQVQVEQIDKDIEAIRNDKKNKSATIIAIITSFGLFALLCTAIYKFGVAETTLNNFDENVKSLATKEDIARLEEEIEAVDVRVQVTENNMEPVILALGDDNHISVQKNDIGELHMSSSDFSADTLIGKNNEYVAKELIGVPILAAYNDESDLNCVFYGTYNDNYHWDGNCVVNAYDSNGNLVYILEAVYDDGTVLRSRQVSKDVTNQEADIWSVMDRVIIEDTKSGDIFNYYRTSEVKQNFSFDSINTNCLIYVKDFKNEFCSQLESVYHGSTQAGYYNDNSGNAYLVKFDTNGYVKTLYIGNFSDGKYMDKSGNAWGISRSDDGKAHYMYTRGMYEDNTCIDKKDFKNYLTLDEINEYTNGYVFNCELQWLVND